MKRLYLILAERLANGVGMNWKLIFGLSLFGLAMGVATVFVIPSNVEPFCWLVVFLVSAFLIARERATGHFVHGLLVGILNSVWVTGTQVLLVHQYIAHHPKETEMMKSMPFPDSPRVMMVLTGPMIGVISGCVIGLLAYIASKFVRPRITASV
jgi:hypothetical protein